MENYVCMNKAKICMFHCKIKIFISECVQNVHRYPKFWRWQMYDFSIFLNTSVVIDVHLCMFSGVVSVSL